MKSASISDAKNSLSALLRLVKRGESVTITEHQQPIAILQPLQASPWEGQSVLQRLAAQGLVQLPKEGTDPEAILKLPLPRQKSGKSLRDAIREERESGR